MNQPLMKWSGSKRSQASHISGKISGKYDSYYEPFCGGCSVLFYLMQNNNGRFRKFFASDLNADLISVYNLVKENPCSISQSYRKHYSNLSSFDMEGRKEYFAEIRSRFNENHNPCDFFWIMRTATNGMPRYNSDGNFNNSFHVTRIGMNPDTIDKILGFYHNLFSCNDIVFENKSYEEINSSENDFVYLDPPYANTKGMYFGGIDNEKLFGFIGNLKSDWMMSYNGVAGNSDDTYSVPESIYDFHEYVESGNSSFRRIVGIDSDCFVRESLYGKIRKSEALI